LAQIGWQDSDNDGIFDVLDVPLGLSGVGRFDPITQTYRFSGSAFVQTLANKNSSGLGNSITLNKITDIQYRFSGDSQWQTVQQPNQYVANLDLTIPILQPDLGRTIEIRAIDSRLGIVSDSFVSLVTGAPKVSSQTGMGGLIWNDTDGDGVMDSTESGRSGWNVQLLNSAGAALSLYSQVSLASVADGSLSPTQFAGVTVSDAGLDAMSATVGVGASSRLGGKSLRPYSATNTMLDAWDASHALEFTFDSDVSNFSIDAFAVSSLTQVQLRYYDDAGQLLGSNAYELTPEDGKQKLKAHDSQSRIHRVVVKTLLGTVVDLGNFEFGIPTTVTSDASGTFRFDAVPTGDYQVQLKPARDIYNFTIANNGIINVGYTIGDGTVDLNLGAQLPPSAWINLANPLDVNGDTRYTALDLLQIINTINAYGHGPLESSNVPLSKLVDTNGDRNLSALDALKVINNINFLLRNSALEGEDTASSNEASPVHNQLVAAPPISAEGEANDDDVENVPDAWTGWSKDEPPRQTPPSVNENATKPIFLSSLNPTFAYSRKSRIQSIDESLSSLPFDDFEF
jgi:hypothetical protein